MSLRLSEMYDATWGHRSKKVGNHWTSILDEHMEKVPKSVDYKEPV